jgi:hypothetical protein
MKMAVGVTASAIGREGYRSGTPSNFENHEPNDTSNKTSETSA